jgi:hypothetical protein
MTQTSTEEQVPERLTLLRLLQLQEPLLIQQLFKLFAHVELVVQARVGVDADRLHFDCWGSLLFLMLTNPFLLHRNGYQNG